MDGHTEMQVGGGGEMKVGRLRFPSPSFFPYIRTAYSRSFLAAADSPVSLRWRQRCGNKERKISYNALFRTYEQKSPFFEKKEMTFR